MAGPSDDGSFLPLLEPLEDSSAAHAEQIDAYLTIANRLGGEEARQFLPAVEQHFSRLGKVTLAHITSPNVELSQAALQALGFCVYHSRVVSDVPETFALEILSALCSLVMKSTDKNSCTRALWVISKQSFSAHVVAKKVPSILDTLDSVWSREDVQSVVMEHEALNVIMRLLEQAPAQMGAAAVRWVKFVIPLVVHSASKVLRAAATMEMGMPLLLEKQKEVAAVIEPMMSSKLIPELQKLFLSKNETNVLKLWPLFVKLLGKLLHKGGPFINSLLHLEELGFRSSSPAIKKIAFIAWKSLIDNFALNPSEEILCSGKRMKLLMQPLSSINVRTEALMLTKVEVWWYLVVQLGSSLSSYFDQVSVPLLQCTIRSESSLVLNTPSKPASQNGTIVAGTPGFNSSANTSRMSLNSSVQISPTFPTIQILGLEMLLHYFLGPEVTATAAKNKLTLSLEPLRHPLLSSPGSFSKHAAVLISNVRDGFINVGKDAPEPLLTVLWMTVVRFVNSSIESGGSKKDRHGCELLTLMLQALQSIAASEALPADRVLILFEATVKGVPARVLGSASYQVGKMDVLNGTPALFLILLLCNSNIEAYVEDERFCQCLQTLVGCGLSGPTSPLAFAEAVLGAIGSSAASSLNKEQLWRMWNTVVNPLTDTLTQSNEVNQGDALEHNFSAMHAALMFPVTHLQGPGLPQATQKAMLSSWSRLYKVFACCSALVATAEENICCEELCTKMNAVIDKEALLVPSTLNSIASILQVMVECVDFSPYTPQFQQKLNSPHTPVNWMKKKNKVLGNLSTFQTLLIQCLQVYLEDPNTSSDATGMALISILSALFTNLALANTVKEVLTSLAHPLTQLYKHTASETPTFTSQLLGKLEKLLGDVLGCLQTRTAVAYDDELLALLSPLLCVLFLHRSKHLRSSVTSFWNSTFANSVSLTYPNEIRPVLSQVKQKTPIILPGFEVLGVPDELSGQSLCDQSESSQLETKLSGLPISSVGKRDSVLPRPELNDKSATKTSNSVSTKLDFGSPKPPRRQDLEEEASIDFVFIPPETKERVLTEHQKEVKRTKRVDIPAMYNNLDASLDTTAFTQYTQSQEDSLDKLQPGQAPVEADPDKVRKELPFSSIFVMYGVSTVIGEATEESVENEPNAEESRGDLDVKAGENMKDGGMYEDMVTESAAVDHNSEEEESKDGTSPNVSGSSDMVSGTPQKSVSRRQSFITLETYSDGKSTSPGVTSTFTGPHTRVTSGQTNKSSFPTESQGSSESTSRDLLSAGKKNSQSAGRQTPDSPQRPKESLTKCEPVRLTERMSSGPAEEDDVIPDSQTDVKAEEATKAAPVQPSSQEETSQPNLDDSQSPGYKVGPVGPRRSGRHRVPPTLPGEHPDDRDSKYIQLKQKHSGDHLKSDSQTSDSSQSGPKTRSRQAAEEEEESSKHRLRTRSLREPGGSGHTPSQGRATKKIKLHSNSEQFLEKTERPESRRRSRDSSQTGSQSDRESQSHGRQGRRGKGSPRNKEEGESSVEGLENSQEFSQKASTSDARAVGPDPGPTAPAQGFKGRTDGKTSKEDSQTTTPSPEDSRRHSPLVTPSNTSPRRAAAPTQLKDTEVRRMLRQDSPGPGEDGRWDKSNTRWEAAGVSEDVAERQNTSSSPVTPTAAGKTEVRVGVRTRSRAAVPAQEGSLSTPESSQSQSLEESTDLSQGRSRYSRRRSSQQLGSLESSESETASPAGNVHVPKKRGRKPRASLQSSPAVKSPKIEGHDASGHDRSLKAEHESADDSQKSHDWQDSESLPESQPEAKPEEEEERALENTSLEEKRIPGNADADPVPREPGTTELQSSEELESPANDGGQTQALCSPEEQSAAAELSDGDGDEDGRKSLDPAGSVDPGEACHAAASVDNRAGCPRGSDEDEDEEEERKNELAEASDESTCAQKADEEHVIQREEEQTASEVAMDTSEVFAAAEIPEPATRDAGSPSKLKDLEALMGPDVNHSPSSRVRGAWSPSASPSTSILKKGQKRALEDETPSPLVKSRRVSFADPIQQQETADDIDRRSPCIRSSSPRKPRNASVSQPKYVTTPTKGLLVLSPRNLRSPGYKSSKKCLISEMGQEPRPVSTDCVYPALVGCSAPVEAVLSQISSNMWSRGFGQLVRARNIKTIGDLSALTATEIKTLPIRSPKISNVKKALRNYEQQRKGRGGDELKSFDETEKMTADPDASTPPNKEEESKLSGDALVPKTLFVSSDCSQGLVPDLDRLACRMTQTELQRCSAEQLVQVHHRLGRMMKQVVEELHSRLGPTPGKP
uniref:Replication timing regulatory factor 1 n=1 Tax=Tetraodon nigroviridis TaxID=99883 RepID=H3D1V0_TETNG